jgi:hypothetical protein
MLAPYRTGVETGDQLAGVARIEKLAFVGGAALVFGQVRDRAKRLVSDLGQEREAEQPRWLGAFVPSPMEADLHPAPFRFEHSARSTRRYVTSAGEAVVSQPAPAPRETALLSAAGRSRLGGWPHDDWARGPGDRGQWLNVTSTSSRS